MKNRKLWMMCACLIIGSIHSFSYSQSIIRQSINSYGASGVIDGISIRQTLGQAYSTSTFLDGKVGLNPGFQQYISLSLNNKLIDNQPVTLDIYPNPAISMIKFKLSNALRDVSIKVWDVNGRIIHVDRITDLGNHSIICEEWPDGIYGIVIYDHGMKALFTSKLIKSK